MILLKQQRPTMSSDKNQEVDIPDFLKKPQEARVTITERILQEFIRHEYHKGIIAGWMCGFLTGILTTLVIRAVLMILGII